MRYSPLRYPGGKGKISKFMKEFVASNFSKEPCYIEPYVGGAEIALTLLLENYVSEIYINDKDYGIYCFWKSILKNTDDFIKLMSSGKSRNKHRKIKKIYIKTKINIQILK